MDYTTIRIKQDDHRILNEYRKDHRLDKMDEAFSKLLDDRSHSSDNADGVIREVGYAKEPKIRLPFDYQGWEVRVIKIKKIE